MVLERSRMSVDFPETGVVNPVFEDDHAVSLTSFRNDVHSMDHQIPHEPRENSPAPSVRVTIPRLGALPNYSNDICSLRIEFSDLSFKVPVRKFGRVKGEKLILDRINGMFRPGELSAIMGPSGAGKSTLMNVLAGYKTTGVTGKIKVNSSEIDRRKFRKHSCYIMQDDCITKNLTVQESMEVATGLKLGGGITKQQRMYIIDHILQLLGLSDTKDTFNMKLSGGQRKRLAIALELVNNPPVMFFDEPTSGLDSSSCYHVISLLRRLAKEGRTIVCTIHQPSARLFEMFDSLYVLSQGKCIYEGSPLQVVPFLTNFDLHCPGYHNPADYIMEVAVGEHGDHSARLVKHMRTIHDSREEGAVIKELEAGSLLLDLIPTKLSPQTEMRSDSYTESSGFPTSFINQFFILLRRTFISILRDRVLTGLRVFAHVVVSLLIGMLYWNMGNDASKVFNNAGCLFFNILFLLFTSMLPTILTFPLERKIFLREHLNYWYSLKSYYLAKTIADFPFQLLFPVLYVTVTYFMTGQLMEPWRYFEVLLMGIMTALVSQSIGLLIGAGSSVETAVFLGPTVSIPILLFSGFFVTFNAIPFYLKWITYISYVRYAFEGTMLATYGYNRTALYCDNFFCLFEEPREFLIELDMDESRIGYSIDFVSLIIIFLALRFAGYFVMRYRLTTHR